MSSGLSRGKQLEFSGFGFTTDDLPCYEDQAVVDPRDWYDAARHDNEFQLEIGSGKGTFLVQESPTQPEVNYLGIEWAGEFFRYAADRVRRHNFQNVRMLHADAVEIIRFRFPESFCSVLHIYFPDPWPKNRHHKRRSICEENLRDFRRILTADAEIRIVTDQLEYWDWIQEHALGVADLYERQPFTPPSSAEDGEIVGTNFERKYRREGRPFNGMVLRCR